MGKTIVTTRSVSENVNRRNVVLKPATIVLQGSPKTSRIFVVFFILLCSVNLIAQTDTRIAEWKLSILNEEGFSKVEQKDRLSKYNFAPLWTQTENSSVFGIIGDDYQRLRIKFLSVKPNTGRPGTYTVTGKSMVKGVGRAFQGTLKLTNARSRIGPHFGLDDEFRDRVKESGVVVGEYSLSEDAKESSTGKFEGLFATYWYIDRSGRLKYDDIEFFADGFLNNQFAGTWTSYRSMASKTANWGDYRIPLAGDFDIGAGEFSPDARYLPFGWQSYRDAYFKNDSKARLEEERHWWK